MGTGSAAIARARHTRGHFRISRDIRLIWRSLLTALSVAIASPAAADSTFTPEQALGHAHALCDSGATRPAIDAVTRSLETHPESVPLRKLLGDLLSTTRNPAEAVRAYDQALAKAPQALDVRWAKWSTLVRWGKADEALAELSTLAHLDQSNPTVHLRLAQELRKADRLEEARASYQHAIALRPDLLAWRLALARTHFDLLEYAAADREVQHVLAQSPPGSPLVAPAKNLASLIHGSSMERGRRFQRPLTPGSSEQELREWAEIRAEAWRLFEQGQYHEAEPLYRRLLALNANDPIATHQLGLTLMQLGRCQDALAVFGTISDLNPSDEDYADTVFRMGQCLVELEQWEDALVHFQVLYDAAVEFDEANRGVPLPPGTRVLDSRKILKWLNRVRPHVPGWESLKDQAPQPPNAPPSEVSEEDSARRTVGQVPPETALDTHASLMGRDADFSWFRFVIPAGRVVRDDQPTGAHEFIPLFPTDTFPRTQRDIVLVFGLVSASYDALPLTAQCTVETPHLSGHQPLAAQDHVLTAMNDQSGYFQLSKPEGGWKPGLYYCGLFVGDHASAYTQVDDVRFQIVEP